MKLTVPTIGRIVHYVRYDGTHCPAIVTWGGTDDGTLHLCLFGPLSFIHEPPTEIVMYARYHPALPEPEGKVGAIFKGETWHWPERGPKVEIDIPDETEKEADP